MRVVGKPDLIDCYRFATKALAKTIKNQRPEPIGDLAPAPWHEMPVNVHRDVYGGVPHKRLDALRVLAVRDQQARVGVAEIMKPDLAESCAAQRWIKATVQQVCVILGITSAAREYEIMISRRALQPPASKLGHELARQIYPSP